MNSQECTANGASCHVLPVAERCGPSHSFFCSTANPAAPPRAAHVYPRPPGPSASTHVVQRERDKGSKMVTRVQLLQHGVAASCPASCPLYLFPFSFPQHIEVKE